MHRGYTKRWRKRWDKGYHEDRLLWIMMDYLVDHASYKDKEIYFKKYGIVKLKRGQCAFSYRSLAEVLFASVQMIRTRINTLKSIGFLTQEPTRNFSILTIRNYDIYNPIDDTEQHTEQHTPNTHLTRNQHKTNKDKKEKKKRFIPPTKNDVIKYFQENGYSKQVGGKAFEYYDTGGWKDSTGKPVKNWKQKMIAVWFKPENEDTSVEGKISFREWVPPWEGEEQYNPKKGEEC